MTDNGANTAFAGPGACVPDYDAIAPAAGSGGGGSGADRHGDRSGSDHIPIASRASSRPRKGFDIVKTKRASLNISFYGLFRYMNQMPGDQTFIDHLGRERAVKARNDLNWHRTFVWLTGLLLRPEVPLQHLALVAAHDAADAAVRQPPVPVQPGRRRWASASRPTSRRARCRARGPSGARSDRQMAEDFFRGGFSSGFFVTGEPHRPVLLHRVGQHQHQPARHHRGQRHARHGLQRERRLEADDRRVRAARRARRLRVPHEARDPVRHVGRPQPRSRATRSDDRAAQRHPDQALRRRQSVRCRRAGRRRHGGEARLRRARRRRRLQVPRLLVPERVLLCASSPTSRPPARSRWTSIFDHGFQVQGMHMVVPRLRRCLRSRTGSCSTTSTGTRGRCPAGRASTRAGTRSWRLNLHLIRVEKSPAASNFGFYTSGQSGTTISIGTDILL